MSVPLPPLAEQQEIVRQVNHYFALADALEARLEQATALVEQLPQALLARAFRGELVPQDPTDEPAAALLALGALALLTGQYVERLLTEPPAPLGAEKIASGLCVALLLIILGRDLFVAPELLVSGQLTETLRWPARRNTRSSVTSIFALMLGKKSQ